MSLPGRPRRNRLPGDRTTSPGPMLRLPDGPRVQIRTFPRTASFQDEVARAWPTDTVSGRDLAAYRSALEANLRRWYQRVRVDEQDQEAALPGADILWYVYRDGRVRPDDERLDGLHTAMAAARRTGEHNQYVMDAARSALELASKPGRKPHPPQRPSP